MIGVSVVTYKRIMTFLFLGMENFPSLGQKTLFPWNGKLSVPGIQNCCPWYGIFKKNKILEIERVILNFMLKV